jgi:hypothetical protein
MENQKRDHIAPSGLPALLPEDRTRGSIRVPMKSLTAIRPKRIPQRNMTVLSRSSA